MAACARGQGGKADLGAVRLTGGLAWPLAARTLSATSPRTATSVWRVASHSGAKPRSRRTRVHARRSRLRRPVTWWSSLPRPLTATGRRCPYRCGAAKKGGRAGRGQPCRAVGRHPQARTFRHKLPHARHAARRDRRVPIETRRTGINGTASRRNLPRCRPSRSVSCTGRYTCAHRNSHQARLFHPARSGAQSP